MTNEAVSMTREFVERQMLGWLETYKENLRPELGPIHQEQLAHSFVTGLFNNALQLEEAKLQKSIDADIALEKEMEADWKADEANVSNEAFQAASHRGEQTI